MEHIEDFLIYLFQDRNLQPSTIDGYKTAIADKIGKDEEDLLDTSYLQHCFLDGPGFGQMQELNTHLPEQEHLMPIRLDKVLLAFPNLSKNQLGRHVPKIVALVVIPGLAPTH